MTATAPSLSATASTDERPTVRSARARGWKPIHGVLLFLLVGLAVFVGRDSLKNVVTLSTDPRTSHILLVPIIAAWLVFVRRERFAILVRKNTWVGPIVVAAGAVIYLTGAETLRFFLWHAGSMLMVLGALFTVVGTDVLRKFGPAFLVLPFAAPMPPQLSMIATVPMMTGAAISTEVILQLFGVGVERAGNLLSINDVEVTVEEACAGMRGVWSLTMVAVAYAFATPLRTWMRIVVLLAAPVLALVCNIIRLVPTVLIYGNYSDETAHTFHDIAGWAVLFVGYFLLTGIAAVLDLAGVPIYRTTPRRAT